MRDKFKGGKGKALSFSPVEGVIGDAIGALLNLGYNSAEAQKAVQEVLGEKKEETDLGKIIAAALQKI